jgi:drug/metabolite transporter (DMT)-like permease
MERVGAIRCLVAAVLFGASAPAASVLAGEMPAVALAGLLYLGAALAVLPVSARRPPDRDALRAGWAPITVAVVAGGALGPALLVAGLARTDAATGSIMLNLELVATVALAATFFREHLGPRVLAGAALVTIGGVLLVWQPGASLDVGALLIAGACLCWGLDNCVTARLDHLAPEHVVLIKGAVAGTANLSLGLTVARGAGSGVDAGEIVAALLIGAAGYGASITLWVKGARDLGAARGQLVFATAPFIGALIAWLTLEDPVRGAQLAAMLLAAAGVAVSLRSAHEHTHHHDPIVHEHEHIHDDGHHEHRHDDAEARGSHRHTHPAIVHSHPHVPDLHHRHEH